MKKKILTIWFTILILFSIISYLPRSAGLPQLTVTAPSSVVEGNTFSISVTGVNNSPVANATVSFNSDIEFTDFSGMATFTAPQVDADTQYPIVATKAQYLDGMTTILVTNTKSITVSSPNGGESWQTGTTHDITWSTTGTITNVRIELYKSGTFNSTITASTQNTGTYAWAIPSAQTVGTTYTIKITSISNTSIYDFSNALFSIVTPTSPPLSTITVISPNGGESWQIETTHSITWSSTGTITNVRIELYKSGTYDSTITASTQNTGTYAWAIPSAQTVGATYTIKITNTSNISIYDYSNTSFTIYTPTSPPPQSSITVIVPNGGQSWQTGTTHDITWATTGTISSVKIELYSGTVFDSMIATSTPNDGAYPWSIPLNKSSGSNYKIKITSTSDTSINDYSDNSFSITSSQPLPSEPQLIIHAPSSAVEGTTFWVTITANGSLIQSAAVTFNDNTYLTNSEGKAQLTAPLIEHDSTFSITATKQGYQSATASITIVNQENIAETGWIYGKVVNTSNASLESANVCVILSDENNVITSKCTSTDSNGTYNISVSAGTYALQAKKEGYATSTVNAVTVQKNTGHEVNFILQNETNGEKNQYLIDYAMNSIIGQGIISGIIDIQSPPQHEGFLTQVSTYNIPISIQIETITPKTLVFNISAPEGTIGKIITVRFGPGTLDDMKNITIIYDNTSIPWVDFDSIFRSDNETNDTARWTSVLAIDGTGNEILYCLLWIPHFSTHKISITTGQIITALSQLMAIVLYIVIIVVLAVVTAVPIVRLWRKIE